MKINKIISALMGGAFLFGMAACHDDVDYTPAEVIPGNCVYFPTDESSTVSIEQDATTCEVFIMRENADNVLTVGLEGQVTDQEGVPQNDIFTVPTQVTFPKGATRVAIPIQVDFSKVVPEYKYKLTLKIKGEDKSPYGLSEQTFTISYEPWTEWLEYRYNEEDGSMILPGTPNYETTGKTGMGTFTEESLYGIVTEVPVYVRASMVNPNKFQIAVPDPKMCSLYNDDPDFEPLKDARYIYIINVDKTLTCNVDGEDCPVLFIPAFSSTVVNSNYGEEMWLMGLCTWVGEWQYQGRFSAEYVYEQLYASEGEPAPSYWIQSKGLLCLDMALTMPSLKGTTSWFGDQMEYLQLPGFKDYTVTMNYTGNFVNKKGVEFAQISAYLGEDANAYSFVCCEGALTNAEAKTVAEELKDNATAELIYDHSATLSFPLENEGDYTIVTASFDENGVYLGYSYYTFHFVSVVGVNRDWVSIGNVTYSEGLIYGHWNLGGAPIGGEEWEVECEASTKTPGFYRLVNPYASWPFAIQYASAGIALTDQNYYLYFNALYDNATYMDSNESDLLGVDFSAMGINGEIAYRCDCAALMAEPNNYPLSHLAKVGYAGTVENGVVAFPAGTFVLWYGDKGSYTNFSDELLDALDAWDSSNGNFFNETVPDPAYGMGYTTIDMSGVPAEYAPGKEHLDLTSTGAPKRLKSLAKKATYTSPQAVSIRNTGKAKLSFRTFKGTKVARRGSAIKATAFEANVKK